MDAEVSRFVAANGLWPMDDPFSDPEGWRIGLVALVGFPCPGNCAGPALVASSSWHIRQPCCFCGANVLGSWLEALPYDKALPPTGRKAPGPGAEGTSAASASKAVPGQGTGD